MRKSRNSKRSHATLEDIYQSKGIKKNNTFFMTQVDIPNKKQLKRNKSIKKSKKMIILPSLTRNISMPSIQSNKLTEETRPKTTVIKIRK